MMPCNCYQESVPKAADMPPKIVETLFLIFNGCATSHVKRLRTDAAHLGLQPTLEITWACHSGCRSQKKYCFLTLAVTCVERLNSFDPSTAATVAERQ